MACPAVSFENVADVLYARLLQQAVRAGAKFNRDTAEMMEIRGSVFAWSRVANTLSITCTKRPFFASCDDVAARITKLINEAREAQ